MLCMQEIFWGGGWFTWNIVSDVYILMKGKKSINAERKCRINPLQTAEWVQNADWESKEFFRLVCDDMSSSNSPSVTQSLFRD